MLDYDYFTWTTNDKLPTGGLKVNERIALRPHDSSDHRGKVLQLSDDGKKAVVLMDVDSREREISLDSRDLRWVFRKKHSGSVLIVPETVEFRSCARSQVFADDKVVELGSSYGDTSILLSRYCQSTVGIDCSLECIQESRRRYPELSFMHLDVFREADRVASIHDVCNVVAVDIGGDRCVRDQLECLHWVRTTLKPELILIKSRHLFKDLRNFAAQSGVEYAGPVPSIEEFLKLHANEGLISGEGDTIAIRKRLSRSGKRKAAAAAAKLSPEIDITK